MKSERILIIDDHALIVEGYKNVLLLDNERYEIDTAFSCEEGYSGDPGVECSEFDPDLFQ